MAVKRSQSASRMLAVFEAVAGAQPIGVSALARLLGADKSAVQRDLMTLADADWIRTAPGSSSAWELSPRILTLARPPHSSDSLRLLARPLLDRLRMDTGETAYLAMQDGDHFVVMAAAESHHPLRMVPAVGIVIPMQGSATARAVLPYLRREDQERVTGGALSEAIAQEIELTLQRGFAVNDEEVQPGAVAIAAAVLDSAGHPLGALVLTGPAARTPSERRDAMGERLRDAARQLSRELA